VVEAVELDGVGIFLAGNGSGGIESSGGLLRRLTVHVAALCTGAGRG
jgi:hypothetical protein